MEKNKCRILLVEDDLNLGNVLKDFLELSGYEVDLANNGEVGLELFRSKEYALCIFDIMLPRMDGLSLSQKIRVSNSEVPIIFLTAKTSKADRIMGFKSGCDDFITKPFSTEELNLRIQVILKRCYKDFSINIEDDVKKEYSIGIFSFDTENMLLNYDGESQSLTKKETELLKLFCQNEGKIVTREFLLKSVWGDDDYFIGRSMDVFISKLRKYLKKDPNVSITNIHGTGFKLETNS